MKYSVVIPLYNEQESAGPLLERVSAVFASPQDFEIICIDDGSTDGTFDVLEHHKHELSSRGTRLSIIKFEKNCGQSAAFDAGFKHARADVIITMDGDLQNPPEEIPRLLEALKSHDVAIGWRHRRNDSFAKKIAGRTANYIRNAFLKDDAHDTGCSLKAFKREVITKIHLYNGMHRFFPALVKMEGFSVAEVKVSHERRKWGSSKYGTFRRAIPAFFDLLAVIWMRKRHLNYKIEKIV